MSRFWPKGAEEKACEFFDLDLKDYGIFMMANTADYLDDEAFIDYVNKEDFDSYEVGDDPREFLAKFVAPLKLPPGYQVVGVGRKDRTGQVFYGVINFTEEGAK